MPTTTGKIYLGSTLVAGGAGDAATWVRPTDWPALPAVVATNQVFYGLHAVFDHGSNFATIRCTGAFTVDWGDGSAPVNVASNTTAEYNYSYSASGLSAVTSRGYKTAIVTVTPQAGQTLSNIDLGQKHTQAGLVNFHTSQWLDVRMAMNNTGTVTTYASGVWLHKWLERFEWIGTNAQTNFNLFLNNCSNLQSLPLFDTSSGTNFGNFLSYCSSLQSVPLFNTSNGTAFNNFLNNCPSLRSVPLFNTSSGTNFSGFLSNCPSLQSVPFFNTSNATSFNGAFVGCNSLKSVPLFDASKVTDFTSFLANCTAIQSIPSFNTSSGTNFLNILANCFNLQSVPLFNTSNGTNFSSFLNGCSALESVPSFNVSSGTSFNNFLAGAVTVSRIQIAFKANLSINLANLSLGPAALNEIYTNLPVAVGSPTITVTGNWGTTAHNPTIATAKGWTVTA